MTLYAPDGLQMIMMERFEGLTSAVDCNGDDGSMFLTFNSQQAYDYALQTWSYVNQNDNDKFLLIANHNGCGPNDDRQPYLINKVTEDTKDLTTFLEAQAAPWSDVAGTYDLDFGKAVPYKHPPTLKGRGIWGDITGGVSAVGNAIGGAANAIGGAVENGAKTVANVAGDIINGDASLSKSVTFSMAAGQEGKVTNIYTDYAGRLKLDCLNCYVTGSFQVTGHLSVQHWHLQDFSIDASPHGFAAELELEAIITSTDKPDSLQYTKELWSAPVPDAGIEVPGIFKLGATLSYNVGVSTSFKGTATVDFGIKSTIPDSAKAVLDLGSAAGSSADGFDGAVTPIFDVKQLSASVTLSAFSQPKLSFGIELTKVGKADIALTISLPEVSVTLAANYDEAGACAHDPGASKTGVKLSSEVGVTLNAQVDVAFGADEASSKPSWSKKLFGISHSLGSMCFPLAIPGIGSTPSATKVPELPSGSASASAVATGPPASVPVSVPPALPVVVVSSSLILPSAIHPANTGKVGATSKPTASILPPGTGEMPGTHQPTAGSKHRKPPGQGPSSDKHSGTGGLPAQTALPSNGVYSPVKHQAGGKTHIAGGDAATPASNTSVSKHAPTSSPQGPKQDQPIQHEPIIAEKRPHNATRKMEPSSSTVPCPVSTSVPPSKAPKQIKKPHEDAVQNSATPALATPSSPAEPKKLLNPSPEPVPTPPSPLEKAVKASSSTTSASSPSITAPRIGGGGCKLRRRNGKRMLVC